MSAKFFLVTGGSGYIAMHVISQLLQQGYRVRTTVRDLEDTNKVDPIKKLVENAKYPIEIVKADLLDADTWINAVKNITTVIHVASPLLVKEPTDEDEAQRLIIKPAVDGTLNVLRACLNTSVERVVFTSSGLTVFGHEYKDKTYSESDWADFDKLKTHYSKSKYLAEKAAWNFYSEALKKSNKCFDLAVIQPVLVLGPVLNSASGMSVTRFSNIFANKIEKIPNLNFAVCDVRDVAAAHIKAAFVSEAIGNRHLIVSADHVFPMKLWVDILKEEFQSKGFKFPTEVDDQVIQGEKTKIDLHRMKNVLGIVPTDFRKTIIDMAYSLLEYGVVKNHI